MSLPVQSEPGASRRMPLGSQAIHNHVAQRITKPGLRVVRNTEPHCRRAPGEAPWSPPTTNAATSRWPAAMPYRSAVVIADFIATSDCFHRRLADLARTLAARICLVQHPAAAGSEQDACTTEILLEGLRHRLGLDPAHCTVLADATQLRRFAMPDARDLVVVGASPSADHVTRATPTASEHAPDCDVMLVEDQPDWD